MCYHFSTHPVPENPITVTASVTDVGSPLAGKPGPTLTCRVHVTTAGLTNTPSAVWMNVSGPVVSGNGVTVTETVVNGTTTISTLSFSPLYTSHAGLYHCMGSLESPPANISIPTPPIPVNVSCELDYVTSYMCTIMVSVFLQCQLQKCL